MVELDTSTVTVVFDLVVRVNELVPTDATVPAAAGICPAPWLGGDVPAGTVAPAIPAAPIEPRERPMAAVATPARRKPRRRRPRWRAAIRSAAVISVGR